MANERFRAKAQNLSFSRSLSARNKQNASMDQSNMLPIAIIVGSCLIAAGLFYFGLTNKEPTVTESANNGTTTQSPEEPIITTVSIDDDAILGTRDTAKVAIVEFSDYECPFCRRFKEGAMGAIKTEYINTGKAILVFRDLPLSSHSPAAEREAMAIECAREQGGDTKYYEFHDTVFDNAPGNNQGISVKDLGILAQEIGLDGAALQTCITENKYKEEVEKDAEDAAKAGIRGTPVFVVGPIDSEGNVKGVLIKGAQPFSVFQAVIDSYLNLEE